MTLYISFGTRVLDLSRPCCNLTLLGSSSDGKEEAERTRSAYALQRAEEAERLRLSERIALAKLQEARKMKLRRKLKRRPRNLQ